jgi:adenosylmethionine-8-amino-7-oxononanoate aminotransferase
VPLVADEVMTGFGRTGALFATLGAGVAPDLLCLAKGLSGGLFPIAATLATEELYEAFLSEDRSRAFFHGHSFTAHPVGCAVARASLDLCREDDVPARLEHIGRRIESGLSIPGVRRRGGIVAADLATDEAPGYLSALALRLRAEAVERGVLLRPLGNVLYAMPPACATDEQCDRIAAAMNALART